VNQSVTQNVDVKGSQVYVELHVEGVGYFVGENLTLPVHRLASNEPFEVLVSKVRKQLQEKGKLNGKNVEPDRLALMRESGL